MKKTIDMFKKGKYISLLTVLCLAFSFAANFRYYINESVYAAFNLGNLGAFGQKLQVSVLVAVFAALGWAAGLLTAFLTRKKRADAVTLYWISGMFAIVALFFTPYNLQLLMPSTIMQNIAMIACIAHIVFILIDMWMFSCAFCVGSADAYGQSAKSGIVTICVAAVIATVLAYVSVASKWSFVVQTAVYGSILTALNVLHAAFPEKENVTSAETVCVRSGVKTGAFAAATLLFAAVLIGAYFITEKFIAIV